MTDSLVAPASAICKVEPTSNISIFQDLSNIKMSDIKITFLFFCPLWSPLSPSFQILWREYVSNFHSCSVFIVSVLSAHFMCATLWEQSNCSLEGTCSYLVLFMFLEERTKKCRRTFYVFLLFWMPQVYGKKERERRREQKESKEWDKEQSSVRSRKMRKEERDRRRQGILLGLSKNNVDVAYGKTILDLIAFWVEISLKNLFKIEVSTKVCCAK